MPLEPGQAFDAMAAAYRHGVLDKSMPLVGEALDGVMAASGLDMGDLVNALDEAEERTVSRLDAMLLRSGLMLRIARSERLMAFASRALDSPLLKRVMARSLERIILKAVARSGPGGDGGCECSAADGNTPGVCRGGKAVGS